MKNELTLQRSAAYVSVGMMFVKRLSSCCHSLIGRLAAYYSSVLGQQVTLRQTFLLLNAQAAFLFTVFPLDCSFVLRLLCVVWLVSALLKCRNSGL